MSELNWINARDLMKPQQSNLKPKVDKLVSKVVGKTVFMRDPRLIQLIVKWKKQANKSDDDLTPDNYLQDPEKIKELKQIFQ